MSEFGPLTSHALGVLLKEMVRRAIETIQAQQFTFEASEKTTSYGSGLDFVTTADHAAQAIYLRMVRECLPGYGIIAEEDELQVECAFSPSLWITIDPLDGTRAFMRRQSHGIGTMVALISEHEVHAAYVGDVTTREIYGYRPGSPKVHRISQYSSGVELTVDPQRLLKRQYLLLHDDPASFSTESQRLFLTPASRLFSSYEITRGSVGIEFSRLWKGEVGGILIRPGNITPWDFAPIIGISRRLGFVFVNLETKQVFEMEVPRTTLEVNAEVIIVHESRVPELLQFV
ncbi:inositol monophosphatase family protein [Microvenator marinus]|uniref:Inositol monophosphatase family protein n=1 Tax=Microvenator marinus TaxID=2600177 RepID=A0A5B8XV61_9DELT|nr:inositol monophosphatase family protein [Microvenator marinus]QED29071.1 inositol monophosphatase family protein [Microvenator marinus]